MIYQALSSSVSPKTAIIMLHGWTGNISSMKPISKILDIKNIKWIFLQGPIKVKKDSFSWFNEKRQGESQLNDSFTLLKKLIKRLNKQGFAYSSIYILGFSQGACLAMEFIIRQSFSIGGIIPVSGFIRYVKGLNEESFYKSKKTKVLILHGKKDEIVSPKNSIQAQKLFLKAGYKSNLHFFNTRHKFPMQAKDLVKKFVLNR